MGLSHHGCDHRRDVPASGTASDVRGRSVLARLLAYQDRASAPALADRLLADHGTLGGVLQASPEMQARALGRGGAEFLATVREAIEEVLRPAIEDRPLLAGAKAVADYLRAAMAHRPNESARVLHLNTRNVLIRDEQVSEGSIDHTPFYVREIARRALELGSSAVILVHNHPSGDPSPSYHDIQITKAVVAGLRPFEVAVYDHIIVAAHGHASLRAMGHL